jgi:hypothetical protein
MIVPQDPRELKKKIRINEKKNIRSDFISQTTQLDTW